MNDIVTMNSNRRGAWIINISKHLSDFPTTNPLLYHLENIQFAGKCGGLLIKLSGDELDKISFKRVKQQARIGGISSRELMIYLDTLKASGCIDWDKDNKILEVLAFSRDRVLRVTDQIFEGSLDMSEIEKITPDLLEYCIQRPRTTTEVKNYLGELISSTYAQITLDVIEAFSLVGVLSIYKSDEKLYFNEYQFGDKAVDIGNALKSLNDDDRTELDKLLSDVEKTPGMISSGLKVSDKILSMAIGLGLVEESVVHSPLGEAKFLSTPRFKHTSIGTSEGHLELDVFHHAKMLLSSFRFGELKSVRSRGRISDPYVLVRALLERDRVGPCTAIGQDYIVLEGEGVIKTTPAKNRVGNQFYMELRRNEPAKVVLDLLESVESSALDSSELPQKYQLPIIFTGPERQRKRALESSLVASPETVKMFLEELRT